MGQGNEKQHLSTWLGLGFLKPRKMEIIYLPPHGVCKEDRASILEDTL